MLEERPEPPVAPVGGKALKRWAEQLAAKPPKFCFSLDHTSDPECRACEWQEPCALMCGHESLALSKPAEKKVKPAKPAEKPKAAPPKDDGLDDLDRELEAASAKKK